MTYDINTRQAHALTSEAIGNVEILASMLGEAIQDVSRSGKPLANDASILLLARKLGAIAAEDPRSDDVLKRIATHEHESYSQSPQVAQICQTNRFNNKMVQNHFLQAARIYLTRLHNLLMDGEGVPQIKRHCDDMSASLIYRAHSFQVQITFAHYTVGSEITLTVGGTTIAMPNAIRSTHPIGQFNTADKLHAYLVEYQLLPATL